MRESLKIVRQALERVSDEGPLRAESPGIVPPSREEMKTSIEGLIYHFKIYTEGFAPPPGEVYTVIESPRGELGLLCRQRRLGEAVPLENADAFVCKPTGVARND